MNTRARVLAAYGNCCAYCGSPGPLEIDHVHGGGNVHRAAIKVKLERWLAQQYETTGYWPPGYQLLCRKCHDKKSGRIGAMPPRKGSSQLNVSLPEELLIQLTALAQMEGFDGSRSKVIETALRTLVECTGAQTAVDTMHQHFSALRADVLAIVQGTEAIVQQLNTRLAHLEQQSTALHEAYASLRGDLLKAYDRVVARQETSRGLLGKIGLK